MKKEKLKKEIIFKSAWDKRHPEPDKNYGIHGVEIVWTLKGEKGGVSWAIYTNWLLDSTMKDKTWAGFKYCNFHEDGKPMTHSMGTEIAYHAKKPQYDGQTNSEGCILVKGGKCYIDCGFMAGDELFTTLKEKGGNAVWQELEKWYYNIK